MTIVQNLIFSSTQGLKNSNNLGQLLNSIKILCSSIGLDWYQFVPGPNLITGHNMALLSLGNYPPVILSNYENQIDALKDPVYTIAIQNSDPVLWQDIFLKAKGKIYRDFITSLRQNGITEGISIPIHGPMSCTALALYATRKNFELNYEEIEALAMFSTAVHQKGKKIIAKNLLGKMSKTFLTAREIECLKWVLAGKTNWEIGVIIGVSARTVQFHLANCARKYCVSTRIQSAMKALLEGQISAQTEEEKPINTFEEHKNKSNNNYDGFYQEIKTDFHKLLL